jgi:hypothetical protein
VQGNLALQGCWIHCCQSDHVGTATSFFNSLVLPGKSLLAGFLSLFKGGNGNVSKNVPNGAEDRGGSLHMNVSKDTDDRGESLRMSIYPLDHSSQLTKAHYLEFDAEPGLEVGDKTSSSSSFESSLEAALLSNLVTLAWGKREQFAAKSKDAAVPEYLWWEHLLEDRSGVWRNSSKTQLLKWLTGLGHTCSDGGSEMCFDPFVGIFTGYILNLK